MDFYNETSMESYNSYDQARDWEGTDDLLKIKTKALQKTKEEIKRVRDEAMESWLDSRPLIDELEKVQSSLAAMKNRIALSTSTISELESQLETTDASIRSKKEDELKIRTTINELNRSFDQTRDQMEQTKAEKDEERRARSELKQVLRLRKQTLGALQLTLRAIRLESEAFGSSAAEALSHVKRSEMDASTVQITQEEYNALTRKAKEETSLAEWRVAVSAEQRLAAEAGRDSALRRMKELQGQNKSRTMKMKEKIDGNATREVEEEQESRPLVGGQVESKQIDFPKARAKLMAESSQGDPRKEFGRSRRNSKKSVKKKKKKKKKKLPFFARISTFFTQKIRGFFG